jgi:hypothetical protein
MLSMRRESEQLLLAPAIERRKKPKLLFCGLGPKATSQPVVVHATFLTPEAFKEFKCNFCRMPLPPRFIPGCY